MENYKSVFCSICKKEASLAWRTYDKGVLTSITWRCYPCNVLITRNVKKRKGNC